jgi:hypothetical protein
VAVVPGVRIVRLAMSGMTLVVTVVVAVMV